MRGLAVEDGKLVFQRLRGDAVAGGDVVHGGHEVGHAGHHRALERVEVVVGAGQHFLEQDVAFAQALEQRDRVGAQDLAGLLHFGDGRDRDLTRLVDGRARRLLEILQRLGHRAGGEVAGGRIVRATSEPWAAIGCEKTWPRVSIDFQASAVTRSMSVVSCVVLVPRASHQRPAAAVGDLRRTIGLLLNIGDDFVSLAGHRPGRNCCWRPAPSARYRPRST